MDFQLYKLPQFRNGQVPTSVIELVLLLTIFGVAKATPPCPDHTLTPFCAQAFSSLSPTSCHFCLINVMLNRTFKVYYLLCLRNQKSKRECL